MIRWTSLALRLLLAGVLLFSAIEKLRRPAPGLSGQRTMYDQWIGVGSAGHWGLIGIEIIVALGLGAGIQLRAFATGAMVLLILYTAVLSLEIAKAQPLPCGCFMITPEEGAPGQIRRQLALGVIRNVILIAAAGQILLLAPRRRDTTAPTA